MQLTTFSSSSIPFLPRLSAIRRGLSTDLFFVNVASGGCNVFIFHFCSMWSLALSLSRSFSSSLDWITAYGNGIFLLFSFVCAFFLFHPQHHCRYCVNRKGIKTEWGSKEKKLRDLKTDAISFSFAWRLEKGRRRQKIIMIIHRIFYNFALQLKHSSIVVREKIVPWIVKAGHRRMQNSIRKVISQRLAH